jgi:hypothetical protein
MGDTSECQPHSVGSAARPTSARTSALNSAWASPARREDAPGSPPSTALSLQLQQAWMAYGMATSAGKRHPLRAAFCLVYCTLVLLCLLCFPGQQRTTAECVGAHCFCLCLCLECG